MSSVSSPGYNEDDNRSSMALNSNGYQPRSPANGPNTPGAPYSPGQRSASVAGADGQTGPGGIAMQDFGADGMPPPPPVTHSWTRIDVWSEENYPELWDNLCTPASVNDVNELEFSLDCSLPLDVRESLQWHDGQERGGRPTGVIFGCMLLDCEEILDEWKNWRVVDVEYGLGATSAGGEGPSTATSTTSIGRSEVQSRQDCHPDNTIQKVYSHPGWIPLARDWNGNNIAVDLAPGPNGVWGQIILTGRDYDCKYVVAKSWGHLLAMVADDMASKHWYVDEETQELKVKDPRAPRSEPSYMDILRVRNERKYGRKRFPPRRPISRPSSKPGSAPGSPHLSAVANGHRSSGLTRPPKEPSNLSDNHLKPPSKKAAKAALRSVTEEPSKPSPPTTTAPAPKAENLLDDAVAEAAKPLSSEALADLKLDDVKLDDDDEPKLKRVSSDLLAGSVKADS